MSLAQKKPKPVIVVGRVLNAADSAKVRGYFYTALQEKTRQNLSESADNFRQILEMDPSNHAALYELAGIYLSQNQIAEAEIYARRAVTVNSDNKWYWLLLGDIYKKTRQVDQLTLVFDELIRINPMEKDYYFDKANALFIQSKYKEAEQVYAEIDDLFGVSADLTNARQRIYQKQGNTDKASLELESLIAANPTDLGNYLSLSEVYAKSGEFEKSITLLNKAKEFNRNDPYIQLALGDAYRLSGKNTDAMAEFKKAFANPTLNIDAKVQILLSFFSRFTDAGIRTDATQLALITTKTHPANPKSFAVYGDILYQDRKFNDAKAAYKKALSLNDQVYQIWEQLLSIEIGLNDFDGAITDGEEALSLFPNQAPLYLYTAIAYLQTKNQQKAISYLNNAISLDAENTALVSQAYATLGGAYNDVKNFKASDEAYEKALKINAENAFVLNNYAYYLSLRGEKLDKAERMSKLSNELQPGNSSFQDTYAWVLFKQKKYKDARGWIEKAIANNSESAVQIEHYGDILFFLGEQSLAVEKWKLAKEKGLKSDILDKKIYEKKYVE